MPAYLQLWKDGATEPTPFAKIDEEICAGLGVPVHVKRYAYEWYAWFALDLANGKNWDFLRTKIQREFTGDLVDFERVQRESLLTIIDYLEQHYRVNAWYSRSKE